MRLEGIHHVTCITGDAPGNVDFYTRVLGLRLVKKTVNQDDPTVYHLYPQAPRGRAGSGMVHLITWRVGSDDAVAFWSERLEAEGVEAVRDGSALRFADPEGLALELAVVDTDDAPLIAEHPEIPAELALQGFDSVRAYTEEPDRSRGFLEETLGFEPRGDNEWEARGGGRGSLYAYDAPPAERGLQGAGTVHHVAWSSTVEDHAAWRKRVADAGAHPTPIIDRFWFKSVYFREPSGVLFEIATLGPGFATDEALERLGERLTLPPDYEHLRDQLEHVLTPLQNPREHFVGTRTKRSD